MIRFSVVASFTSSWHKIHFGWWNLSWENASARLAPWVSQWCCLLIDDSYRRAQFLMAVTPSGWCNKNEQTHGSVSSTPLWYLHRFCLWVSALHSYPYFPEWWAENCKLDKPSFQVAFGHAIFITVIKTFSHWNDLILLLPISELLTFVWL